MDEPEPEIPVIEEVEEDVIVNAPEVPEEIEEEAPEEVEEDTKPKTWFQKFFGS